LKLLFDTSVWVDDLRRGGLRFLMPRVRGSYFLWMDSVVVGELRAGCSGRRERRVVDRLVKPFRDASRILTANAADYERAGGALSTLREAGKPLGSGGFLDALQAVNATRWGALLVTLNSKDFRALATCLPLKWQSLEEFRTGLPSRG
jgi:predicted nucleic acid-binding protein